MGMSLYPTTDNNGGLYILQERILRDWDFSYFCEDQRLFKICFRPVQKKHHGELYTMIYFLFQLTINKKLKCCVTVIFLMAAMSSLLLLLLLLTLERRVRH